MKWQWLSSWTFLLPCWSSMWQRRKHCWMFSHDRRRWHKSIGLCSTWHFRMPRIGSWACPRTFFRFVSLLPCVSWLHWTKSKLVIFTNSNKCLIFTQNVTMAALHLKDLPVFAVFIGPWYKIAHWIERLDLLIHYGTNRIATWRSSSWSAYLLDWSVLNWFQIFFRILAASVFFGQQRIVNWRSVGFFAAQNWRGHVISWSQRSDLCRVTRLRD